jgi:hypothetical protein
MFRSRSEEAAMRRTIILLLGLLVACGQARTVAGSGKADVVPWIDTAYVTATPSPLPPDAGSCSAADLEIGPFGDAGPAAGTIHAEAEVRNISSSPCALTPKSAVLYRDDDGKVVQNGTLETYGDAVFVPTAGEEASDRAKGVRLRIAIPNVCPPPVATELAITLFPGTETMDLPPGSGGPSPSPDECGEAGDYTLSVEHAETEPESPLADLTAEIRAPEVVAPGSSFRYLVHVTNPTAQAVALDPCPGYTEGFKAPHGGQANYLLNCSEVTSIGPGETVVYEMYLEVPEDFGAETNPERRALLTWAMLGGGPSANAEVQVAG